MKKFPKPWSRPSRGVWYVTLRGTQHNLGPDAAEARKRYHELMARPPAAPEPQAAVGLAVAELFEKYLGWCSTHRAPRTCKDHRDFIQQFLDESPGVSSLPAMSLRPFHVIEWFGVRWSSMLVWCDRCGDCQPNAWRCRRCQAMLPHHRDYLRRLVRDLVVAFAIGGLLGLGYLLWPLFR